MASPREQSNRGLREPAKFRQLQVLDYAIYRQLQQVERLASKLDDTAAAPLPSPPLQRGAHSWSPRRPAAAAGLELHRWAYAEFEFEPPSLVHGLGVDPHQLDVRFAPPAPPTPAPFGAAESLSRQGKALRKQLLSAQYGIMEDAARSPRSPRAPPSPAAPPPAVEPAEAAGAARARSPTPPAGAPPAARLRSAGRQGVAPSSVAAVVEAKVAAARADPRFRQAVADLLRARRDDALSRRRSGPRDAIVENRLAPTPRGQEAEAARKAAVLALERERLARVQRLAAHQRAAQRAAAVALTAAEVAASLKLDQAGLKTAADRRAFSRAKQRADAAGWLTLVALAARTRRLASRLRARRAALAAARGRGQFSETPFLAAARLQAYARARQTRAHVRRMRAVITVQRLYRRLRWRVRHAAQVAGARALRVSLAQYNAWPPWKLLARRLRGAVATLQRGLRAAQLRWRALLVLRLLQWLHAETCLLGGHAAAAADGGSAAAVGAAAGGAGGRRGGAGAARRPSLAPALGSRTGSARSSFAAPPEPPGARRDSMAGAPPTPPPQPPPPAQQQPQQGGLAVKAPAEGAAAWRGRAGAAAPGQVLTLDQLHELGRPSPRGTAVAAVAAVAAAAAHTAAAAAAHTAAAAAASAPGGGGGTGGGGGPTGAVGPMSARRTSRAPLASSQLAGAGADDHGGFAQLRPSLSLARQHPPPLPSPTPALLGAQRELSRRSFSQFLSPPAAGGAAGATAPPPPAPLARAGSVRRRIRPPPSESYLAALAATVGTARAAARLARAQLAAAPAAPAAAAVAPSALRPRADSVGHAAAGAAAAGGSRFATHATAARAALAHAGAQRRAFSRAKAAHEALVARALATNELPSRARERGGGGKALIEQRLEVATLTGARQYDILVAAMASPAALEAAYATAASTALTLEMVEAYHPAPTLARLLDADDLGALVVGARARCAQEGAWEAAGVDLWGKVLAYASPYTPLPSGAPSPPPADNLDEDPAS
jgi:hypothetical protein